MSRNPLETGRGESFSVNSVLYGVSSPHSAESNRYSGGRWSSAVGVRESAALLSHDGGEVEAGSGSSGWDRRSVAQRAVDWESVSFPLRLRGGSGGSGGLGS